MTKTIKIIISIISAIIIIGCIVFVAVLLNKGDSIEDENTKLLTTSEFAITTTVSEIVTSKLQSPDTNAEGHTIAESITSNESTTSPAMVTEQLAATTETLTFPISSDLYFVEKRSDATGEDYYPAIVLYSDGKFEFLVNLYSGMGFVYGTYSLSADIYSFKVTEMTFWGWVGDDVTEFTMKNDVDTLTYLGKSIGMTEMGSVFHKSNELPLSIRYVNAGDRDE